MTQHFLTFTSTLSQPFQIKVASMLTTPTTKDPTTILGRMLSLARYMVL
jgi:hypothetical protein